MPQVSLVSVAAEDFKSLDFVWSRVCDQLVQSTSGRENVQVLRAPGQSDSGLKWPEDDDQLPTSHGASLADCLQHLAKIDAAPSLVVLVVERVDSVPKDLLREFLICLSSTCGEELVPLSVIFTLQHPPQSRLDLFEDELIQGLRLSDATCLFNAQEICSEILEHMVERPACPLTLPPVLFDWLRRDRFE